MSQLEGAGKSAMSEILRPKSPKNNSPQNVVGAPLSDIQRLQALVKFLDLTSLRRLGMTSRAERDAQIGKHCLWVVFNQQHTAFKLKEITRCQCKRMQVLDLHNAITAVCVPLLVKIIADQPLLKTLGLSSNGLDKRDAEKAESIRGSAARLRAGHPSREKFLQKAEMLHSGALPLIVTCLRATGITALDLSENEINEDGNDVGVLALVDALGSNDIRTLSNLNIGCNRISNEQMAKIMANAMAKESMKILCDVPIKDKALTALDVSGRHLGTEGALVLMGYLSCHYGALSKLDMSECMMVTLEAGKALGDMLAINTVLTDLDVSKNVGMPFVLGIADGLSSNSALEKFTFGGDLLPSRAIRSSKPVTLETSMTEADFTGKNLLGLGAIVLGAFLPKCK
jgi:hypothetical protein